MRIVVKIGSSSLTETGGRLSRTRLDLLVDALSILAEARYEVIVVTSGAIASGFPLLGMRRRPREIAQKQAAASVGQGILMHFYSESFSRHSKTVAQLLVTRRDLIEKKSYDNVHATLNELLVRKVIPIINENDTVATEELRFGDNDILSAYVGGLIHADLLIIITDTDGIYTADPRLDPSARRIDRVSRVTRELVDAAGGSQSSVGTGGMRAKILAARRAMELGLPVFIGAFRDAHDLLRIVEGSGDGTYLGDDSIRSISKKRQWIALHGQTKGRIYVDEGAARALIEKGRSLLSAGITGVDGIFSRKDLVEIHSGTHFLGRGITSYSSIELDQIKGKNSSDVGLPFDNARPEVVHRNDWVSSLVDEE